MDEDVNSAGLATGLFVDVAPNLPPPHDTPTPEQQAFYVALTSTLTVIKAACLSSGERKLLDSWRRAAPTSVTSQPTRGERVLDQYVRKLGGVARLGLQYPHSQMAQLALDGLKAEFVAHEAGRLKNSYMRKLGRAAVLWAVVVLAILVLVLTNQFGMEAWNESKPFLIAGIGACAGTWLSFSIRRVNLTFGDLAVLEDDLLEPSARIVFVLGLTTTACLLFSTSATNVEIGDLKTAELGKTYVALLVGLFCGIGERALATAISGRAVAFVRSSVSSPT